MPAPTNPPYSAGAVMQPRKLQRWLDINQVSALRRAQTYFTVPLFSINSNWRGYSELLAVFNYTSSNNFSIKLINTTFPASPNYLACIVWIDDNYNVYRYKLWENVGEKLLFDVNMYGTQLIKKNFRIEIWSVDQAPGTFSLINGDEANGNYIPWVDPTVYNGEFLYYRGDTFYALKTLGFAAGAVWSVFTAIDSYYDLQSLYANDYPIGTFYVVGSGSPPPVEFYKPQTFSQAAAFNIYTTILQPYDYRYVSDTTCAVTPTILTNLSLALPVNLPMAFPANSSPTINT